MMRKKHVSVQKERNRLKAGGNDHRFSPSHNRHRQLAATEKAIGFFVFPRFAFLIRKGVVPHLLNGNAGLIFLLGSLIDTGRSPCASLKKSSGGDNLGKPRWIQIRLENVANA